MVRGYVMLSSQNDTPVWLLVLGGRPCYRKTPTGPHNSFAPGKGLIDRLL